MIKKSLYLALPLTLSILLSGCGESSTDSDKAETSSENTSKTSQVYTATFNALSSGVTYQCGSQKGVLSDAGVFKFEDGKDCTFYDGNTVIKEVVSSNLKDGITIDESSTVTQEETKKVEPTTKKLSELAKLLIGKTYYSVQPQDSRVIILEFEEKSVKQKVNDTKFVYKNIKEDFV